ncbi:MAG: citrate (Si)-synthase, partial [Hyphomicrobium sp.]|nr:citrate (Si)-synthase [Hyphomicrobium sp.]
MSIHDSSTPGAAATRQAELKLNGKSVPLDVRRGTIGPDVMDIGSVFRDTGCFTYDPGFTSTANCSSAITFIDGDKGELL